MATSKIKSNALVSSTTLGSSTCTLEVEKEISLSDTPQNYKVIVINLKGHGTNNIICTVTVYTASLPLQGNAYDSTLFNDVQLGLSVRAFSKDSTKIKVLCYSSPSTTGSVDVEILGIR